MLFNSWQFLVFFPVVTSLYFLLPQRLRWILLLAASCVFYMALIPIYILILLFTILVDYCIGLAIGQSSGKLRKTYLIISLTSNLAILAFFKYYNFLNVSLASFAHFIDWNYPVRYLAILLPIGLSFHTFQGMSYTIDIYSGKQKAEKNLGIFALYIMFYPQLVAGPIERAGHMLPQFRRSHSFEYKRVTDGLKLMAWGMFKKVAIADRLALPVQLVFSHPMRFKGIQFILATVLFAYQIYCDFSGYSDIAVGAGEVMGFELVNNFNRPYYSKSLIEFWRRWHISLSSWFRDYVYIPLGGNRVPRIRVILNLFVVFFLSGLWHGANWTFAIWGLLHGGYVAVEHGLQHYKISAFNVTYRWMRVFITFSLVTFAWIFFRADSFHTALYIVTHLFTDIGDFLGNFLNFRATTSTLAEMGLPFDTVLIIAVLLVTLETVQLIQRRSSVRNLLSGMSIPVRWGAYLALTLAIMNLGVERRIPFIYFQF